jgi:hypothetical protein
VNELVSIKMAKEDQKLRFPSKLAAMLCVLGVCSVLTAVRTSSMTKLLPEPSILPGNSPRQESERDRRVPNTSVDCPLSREREREVKSQFEAEPRKAAAALMSVIIPFNKFRRHTLLQATHSALNQSYPNVEVILVDSSEDPRAKELDEMTFQGKVKIKHLPSIEGNFAGYNRNQGALLSSGEFLAFLDSDDAWFPNKLEQQFLFAKLYDVLDFFGSEAVHVKSKCRYEKKQTLLGIGTSPTPTCPPGLRHGTSETHSDVSWQRYPERKASSVMVPLCLQNGILPC